MKKWIVIIGVLAVLAGAGVAVVRTTRSGAPQQTMTTVTASTPKQEEKVAITLPGKDAVDARVEDYNNPSSLWVVVNKDLPLSDPQYRPSDLTLLADTSRTDKSNDERSIRAVAVADFNAMVTDAKTAGYDLIIGSGFRSYALQATYYNNYVATYGLEGI